MVHMASSISEHSSKSETAHGTPKNSGHAILDIAKTADTLFKAYRVTRLQILASLDSLRMMLDKRMASYSRFIAPPTGLAFRDTALVCDITNTFQVSPGRPSTLLVVTRGATYGANASQSNLFEAGDGHFAKWPYMEPSVVADI